jgi:hypothetical protein
MRYRKPATAILLVTVAALALWLGPPWWRQRQWFALQSRQMATIQRFETFPPSGWDHGAWRNALVTPYNVWGNVTYTPAYSKISISEMQELQTQLDRILAETSPDNSAESIDRIFGILLQRGQRTEFITGFRDEFRAYHDAVQRKVLNATDVLEPAPRSVSGGESSPPVR